MRDYGGMRFWTKSRTAARPAPGVLSQSVPLRHGGPLPRLGLGVYKSKPGKETQQAVEIALEWGYRHVDTAAAYRNEADVGSAIRNSGIPREDIFVTTKLFNPDHGFDKGLAAFEHSLKQLRLEYVDLYLIHWPVANLRLETWRALERIHREGRARAIGVSNYLVRHLEELLAASEVKPAVNQIELHPFIYRTRKDTVDFCHQHNIVIESYSPLTKGMRIKHPVVKRIARAHDRTPAQILIRYCLEKNTVVLPKSVHRDRIRENADVFDFTLHPAEVEELDGLDENLATGWDPAKEP
jgi:diketogulonate reductase-like aldo/keto reductase